MLARSVLFSSRAARAEQGYTGLACIFLAQNEVSTTFQALVTPRAVARGGPLGALVPPPEGWLGSTCSSPKGGWGPYLDLYLGKKIACGAEINRF